MSSQSDLNFDVVSPSSVLSKLNFHSHIADELDEFEVLSFADTYAIYFSGVSCFWKQKYITSSLEEVQTAQLIYYKFLEKYFDEEL